MAGHARAQEAPRLRLEVRGETAAEAQPGGVVTRALVLRAAEGGEAVSVSLEVGLPEGWRLTLPLRGGEVEAGGAATRLASIVVASQAEARSYAIPLVARAAETGEVLAEALLEVRVSPLLRLTLDVTEAPPFVQAGTRYAVGARLANTGTAGLDVRLSARERRDYAARIEPQRVRLEPGESAEVTARIETPEDLVQRASNTFRLVATGTYERGEERDTVAASASATVSILPNPDVLLAKPRWPLRLTVAAASGEDGSAAQLWLEGSGTLVEDESLILEADVRAPDEGRSLLLDPDVYRLRYATPRLRIEAGDFSEDGTALGVPTRQGFGLGAGASLGEFDVSAFAQEGRRRPFDERMGGVRVRRDWGEAWSAEASLRSSRDELEAATGGLLLLRAAPHPLALVEVEVGLGTREPVLEGGILLGDVARASESDGPGAALRVQSIGAAERWSYAAEVLTASPQHSSSYYGSTQGSLAARVDVSEAWRASASASSQRRAYRLRDGEALRRSASALRSALSYRRLAALRVSASLGAEVRRQQAEPVGGRPGADRREVGLTASGSVGRPRWSVTGRVSARAVSEDLSISASAARRSRTVRASLRARLSRRAYTVSAGLRGLAGTLLGGAEARSLYATLGGQRLGRRLRLTAATTVGREAATLVEGAAQWTASVETRARLALPREHEVEATARYVRLGFGSAGGVPEVGVRYAVPLGLPIVRPASLGIPVEGVLRDAATGAPVPRVLLSAGGATVLTERDGSFRLVLPPGTHALVADPASLGAGRVLTVPLPLELAVAADQPPPPLALEVTDAVTLRGRIAVYEATRRLAPGEAPDSTAFRETGGVQGALVEVTDGAERFRAITDRQGRFFFTGLRPGEWTVRIVRADLPDNYALDEDAHVLTLAPGAEETATFAARPEQRRIRFVRPGN